MIKITKEKIEKSLNNLPFSFEIFDVIDSTNTYAKKIIGSGNKDKTVIISDAQTSGRGRVGKSFHSPSDNGIYMSIILKVDKAFDDLNLLTVAVATLTLKAIERVSGKKFQVKWVNDLFLNNKKVCGILCENILSIKKDVIEYVVIGIGINVKSTLDFPSELKDIAGCIEEVDRNVLIAEILKEIYSLSKDFLCDKYLPLYRERSMVLNKTISFVKNDVCYTGKAIKINDMGNLIVLLDNNEEIVLKSGEISIKMH